MRSVSAYLLLCMVACSSLVSHGQESKPAATGVDKALKAPKPDVSRFWVTPEFLLWWSKDMKVKDTLIVRTTDFSWPDLNSPTAQRLFDNDDQEFGAQLGGRLTFGMWVNDDRDWGFELSGFALEEEEDVFKYTPGVNDMLGLTYLNAASGTEGGILLKLPFETGKLEVRSSTQLWGVEGLGLKNLIRGEHLSLDGSFGVRHLDLAEEFSYQTNTTIPRVLKDSFETHNQFYGAKLGVKLNYTAWDRLLLNVEPSVALGAVDQTLKVRGSYYRPAVWPSGSPPGGYLAIEPLLGDHSKTQFAVVPEIKIGLGCKITKTLSFNANYNFLYVSNVIRAGEQPNRRINVLHSPAAGPGGYDPTALPNEPGTKFRTTDFWAHGLGANFKIQF